MLSILGRASPLFWGAVCLAASCVHCYRGGEVSLNHDIGSLIDDLGCPAARLLAVCLAAIELSLVVLPMCFQTYGECHAFATVAMAPK